jgi:Conserved hypothetical protein 698
MKSVVNLSPLVVAVVVGIIVGNAGLLPARLAKDAKTLGKKLLRTGVALLGFRLALGDVADLGPATILCVVAVVLATFFGTQWLTRVLGLSKGLGLLLGTGYAICGASAIAAMEPNADAEPEEVAYALSLVTLCGTLSIAVLPPIGRLFKMSPATFGVFSGAAVHDVAQVVATSSADVNVSTQAPTDGRCFDRNQNSVGSAVCRRFFGGDPVADVRCRAENVALAVEDLGHDLFSRRNVHPGHGNEFARVEAPRWASADSGFGVVDLGRRCVTRARVTNAAVTSTQTTSSGATHPTSCHSA